MDSKALIELDLTELQAAQIPEPGPRHALFIGSIQRRQLPHDKAGEWFFRGQWLSSSQAAKLRKAARTMSKRKEKPRA